MLIKYKAIILLGFFIFGAYCTRPPEKSTVNLEGNIKFDGKISEPINAKSLSLIRAVALTHGTKAKPQVHLSIAFQEKRGKVNTTYSIKLNLDLTKNLETKHTLFRTMMKSHFALIYEKKSFVKNSARPSYETAVSGECEIDKIRFGKDGFVKGSFNAKLGRGNISGKFNVLIDYAISSYKG